MNKARKKFQFTELCNRNKKKPLCFKKYTVCIKFYISGFHIVVDLRMNQTSKFCKSSSNSSKSSSSKSPSSMAVAPSAPKNKFEKLYSVYSFFKNIFMYPQAQRNLIFDVLCRLVRRP